MVWARTKLMLQDDLMKPRPVITFNFEGPDPEKFYHEIPSLLAKRFRITEHSIQERKFQWTKGDPEKFKIVWEVNKDIDRYSYYWIEVSLEGSSSKNHGKAAINITGALRTEYLQDTIWEKSILYEVMRMVWHSTFYNRKREIFMQEGRKNISSFMDDIKSLTRS